MPFSPLDPPRFYSCYMFKTCMCSSWKMSCDCGPVFFFYLVTGKRGMNKWNEADLAFQAPDSQTDGLCCSATAIKARITSTTSLTRAPSKTYSTDLSTSHPMHLAYEWTQMQKYLSKERKCIITLKWQMSTNIGLFIKLPTVSSNWYHNLASTSEAAQGAITSSHQP